MLGSLVVKNFAIIDDINIQFDSGLNIITGESGAGKSILIKALSLLTGERADTSLIASGASKATISAEFIHIKPEILSILAEYDLDSGDECIIRRTIDASGKSKAYVNDVPASLATLKKIAQLLITISSQNSHQLLLDTHYQRTLIDSSEEIATTLHELNTHYQAINNIDAQIHALTSAHSLDPANIDFLEYQYKELSDLALDQEEAETIEERYEHYINDKHTITDVAEILSQIESAEQYLNTIEHLAEKVSSTNAKLLSSFELATSCKINFTELHYEIQNYLTSIGDTGDTDLEERISTLYDMARKHNCTIIELPNITTSLEQQLLAISNSEDTLKKLQAQYTTALQQYQKVSKTLTQQRTQSAALLSERVNAVLGEFAMSYMQYHVSITTDVAQLSPHGNDSIEFMIASGNSEYHQLRKIASGGELSRINLAISVTSHDQTYAPVLVFDEVDTGISGEIANIVGVKLKELSHIHQTICITHQPQVAAKSDKHIRITKVAAGDAYTSSVHYLTEEEKLKEIATLIGGNSLSEHHLASAKEMMN